MARSVKSTMRALRSGLLARPLIGVVGGVLTVAQRGPADLPTLLAMEQEVQPHLPIPARIGQALLIAGGVAPNSWRIVHSLMLGGAAMPPE